MIILSFVLDVLFTIIELFCMYLYAEILFGHRFQNTLFRYTSLSYLRIPVMTSTLITLLLNSIILTSPHTFLIMLGQSVLTIFLFWDCDLLNAVTVAGGYFLAMSISNLAEASIIGLIGGDELLTQITGEQGGPRAVYLLLCGSYWLAINMLLAAWLRKKKFQIYGMKGVACLCVVGTLGISYLCAQILEDFNVLITAAGYGFIFMISVGIFALYYRYKSNRLQQTIELLDAQNEMLEKNYQRLSDYYTANARLYHDLDHHMKMLYHMLERSGDANEGEAKKYLEAMDSSIEPVTVVPYSGNEVLDVILSEMERSAQAKGIQVKMEVQTLPQDIGIEKKDICALFANLLENALEAASSEILVVIKNINRMLMVRIENDYRNKPIIRNGRLQTTKKDKSLHGWGTRNIEFIVGKYDGTIEYKIQDNKFCVDILTNYK